MAAVGAPIVGALAPDDLVFLLGNRVLGAERGLHVLQGKGHLLGADALGLAAELGTAQDVDDVIEPLVLLGEPLDLGGQHRVLVVEPRCSAASLASLPARLRSLPRSLASLRSSVSARRPRP